MKRRFTEEQIISVLRAAQQGAKRGRLAPWSKRSSGATGSRSKRLHGLGAEHLLGIHGHEVAGCQRRSKISPPGRSKTSPLNVMRYAVLGGCPGSP